MTKEFGEFCKFFRWFVTLTNDFPSFLFQIEFILPYKLRKMDENWKMIIKVFESLPRKNADLPKLVLLSNDVTDLGNRSIEVIVTKSDHGYYIARKIKCANFDLTDIQNLYVEDVTPRRISCYALGKIWSVQVINH